MTTATTEDENENDCDGGRGPPYGGHAPTADIDIELDLEAAPALAKPPFFAYNPPSHTPQQTRRD